METEQASQEEMTTLLSVEGKTEWIRQAKKKLTLLALKEARGNRTHAAKMLGISIRSLRNTIRDYRLSGLEVPSAF